MKFNKMQRLIVSSLLSLLFWQSSLISHDFRESLQGIETIEQLQKVDHLLLLMQKRLAIMHDVARWKWKNQVAVEDLEREKQSIQALIKAAEKSGVNVEWVTTFFQAQMDAAKQIQLNDIASWKAKEVELSEALDLKTAIRPYLDRLNIEMIQALARLNKETINPEWLVAPISSRLQDQVDEKVWQLAVQPLVYFKQ